MQRPPLAPLPAPSSPALRLAVLLALALPAPALHAATYAQMEQAAREHASGVQASQAERAAATARRDAAASDGGPRVFAAAGYTDAREPVTESLVRNYGRAQATVGVRWPLLASQLSQKRGVTEAEWDMARAQLRADMAANEAVRRLRAEAVRAAHARDRIALTQRYLQGSQPMVAQFEQRVKSGVMLAAEAMELADLRSAAQAQLARHEQALVSAEKLLAHHTGLSGGWPRQAPSWSAACFNPHRLMEQDGRGKEAEQEINLAAASAQLQLLDGGVFSQVEAGVQVSHTRMSDSPGHSGRNTGVSVDVQIPLQWRGVRDGRRGEWSARRQQAKTLLDEARQMRQLDIDRGLRERSLLEGDLEQARGVLRSAQEGWRVASLRLPALDADGMVRHYRAYHGVFGAGMRVIDLAERLRLAEVDLLALGPECGTLAQDGETAVLHDPWQPTKAGAQPSRKPSQAPANSKSPKAATPKAQADSQALPVAQAPAPAPTDSAHSPVAALAAKPAAPQPEPAAPAPAVPTPAAPAASVKPATAEPAATVTTLPPLAQGPGQAQPALAQQPAREQPAHEQPERLAGATSQVKAAAKPKTAAAEATVRMGWYVWQAQSLLDKPELLQSLPATERLLLSFTAAQLRQMQPASWQRLQDQAKRQGIRLELLLGDPEWVKPQGRKALLDLLKNVQSLRVDALNLDLEHSQLPPGSMSATDWKDATVETMRAVRRAVRWPLALTTHHRDLNDPAFLGALHQVGVTEVVPMVYSQSEQRVREVARRVLTHARHQAPGMRVALAQSIERELSEEESSFHKGRSQSLAQWSALARELGREPHFSGVIVQSLADYQQAKP